MNGPRRAVFAATLYLAFSFGSSARPIASIRAIVLGLAQDGGVPHIGCSQPLCERARRDPSRRQRVACVGLVDDASGQRFLIDATPDLPSQIESLGGPRPRDRARPLDGILLTHAHIGHYAGLMYLGREALGARGVPVYATPRMARFLRENGPWSQLVSLGNVELREIEPGVEVALTERLRVTALTVPHRDEFSDTVAYRVRGPRRSLLYVPDIDKWERWERKLEDEVGGVDVALLDGTFHDASEIPGRSRAEIPHPLVQETLSLLGSPRFTTPSSFGSPSSTTPSSSRSPLLGVPSALRSPLLNKQVLFIHLNHTNRLYWDKDARRRLERAGAGVAQDGQELPL